MFFVFNLRYVMRILIIEDEIKIALSIAKRLKDNNYAVDIVTDGVKGEEFALTNEYDAIILDVMLPKQDGWTVCKNLRNNKILTPILMLTALDETYDKIKGLDEGADDYMSKPFNFAEMLARIRSLIRRNSIVRSTKIEKFGLVLNQNTKVAYRNNTEIILSAKEYSILELFMMNPDKILSRKFISEHVWDMNFDPRSNVIESFIKYLRKKIDKDFKVPLIHTVRGAGYIFAEKGR